VLELIERKAQGKAIAIQPAAEEPAAPAPDLMSALKASLDAVRPREGRDAADGVGSAAKPRKAAKKPAAKKAGAVKAAAPKSAGAKSAGTKSAGTKGVTPKSAGAKAAAKKPAAKKPAAKR
jgi:DNA end-binding protein Ku